MAPCDLVKRVPRKRLLLRWCGFAGLLGGVLFVVWGYIDRPNIPETLKAAVHVFAFVVPTLFLAAVVGLSVLWQSRLGMLGWMGMALAVYAWGWSVVGAIVGEEWAVTRDRRSGACDGGLRLGLQLDRLRRGLGSALGARWFRAAIQSGLGGAGGGAFGGGH